jgi:hypothetical protein
MNSSLAPRLLALFKAALQRKITDVNLSFNGGSKETVKAMVAEAKATIPTLGLPPDQPVKVRCIPLNQTLLSAI